MCSRVRRWSDRSADDDSLSPCRSSILRSTATGTFWTRRSGVERRSALSRRLIVMLPSSSATGRDFIAAFRSAAVRFPLPICAPDLLLATMGEAPFLSRTSQSGVCQCRKDTSWLTKDIRKRIGQQLAVRKNVRMRNRKRNVPILALAQCGRFRRLQRLRERDGVARTLA